MTDILHLAADGRATTLRSQFRSAENGGGGGEIVIGSGPELQQPGFHFNEKKSETEFSVALLWYGD
jgi:hypothetical protein